MLHRRHNPSGRPFVALMGTLAAAVCVGLLLTACGGGASGDARTLLRQTFSGQHKVNSGNLRFNLSVLPRGSSTLTQPISLAFAGPFQSLGTGKLPKSNFTVSISAQGHTGSLSILSTGTKGFVTLSGVSYQLPAASFQRLESSFSSIASSSSGSASQKQSTLSRLGINPLDWLNHPTVVGSQTVGGTQTTHIRAQINVPALLRDLSTFLQKASSLGVSGATSVPGGLSAATQQRIAGAVRSPRFDLWTGSQDKTVRRMSVGLTLPVTGQISSLLGGMRSAGIDLTLQYSDLNQPQTITAPTNVQPYSIFASKLNTLLQAVQSAVSSGALGGSSSNSSGSASSGSTGSTGGTSTTGGSGLAGATTSYSQCIQNAGQDVAKMQKCASLLGSG